MISSSQLVFYTNAVLRLLTSTNDSLTYQPADYQVSVNRIVYQTTLTDGTTITASGIVYLPNQLDSTSNRYPLLSFQHPTAFSNTEVPSGTNFGAASFSYPLYFATHGYIVACPDYIGYGAADHVPHNYEHRQTLAQATVDMMLATKAFLAQKGVPWTNQLFLAGYSEGGFATLSAQQLLEEKYGQELPLSGSSCGAGPYAMSDFFRYVTQNTTVGGIANYIYAWETLSYNRIYGLNKPVSYYFKAPYAEQITQSLDSTRSITASFDQLCTDEFRADVRNPLSPFGKALADNDLTTWHTATATQLIHSQQDEIIPFLTSQQTYTAMRQRGSANLHLVAIPSGSHVPTEVLFMRRSLDWFEQLKK
ncbi:hypothetical protein GCM10028825_08670 [Spirosoma agri]